MDTRLSFADELERRDARVAQALADVERLEGELEQIRTRGTAGVTFLASLPAALAEADDDERAAAAAHRLADDAVREAEATLERSRKDDERLAAERALQQAGDRARAAAAWFAQTRDGRLRLEAEGAERRAESALLEARGRELAAAGRAAPPPGSGLEGVLAWASRARGELLLERAALAGERESLVREASELLTSVLGEPFTSTGVAGVRDRLERALGQT